MIRLWLLPVLILAAPAQAQCRLCAPGNEAAAAVALVPLAISIDTTLDLGRAAQTRAGGGGTIALDARSGSRTVTGTLANLGGMSLRGVIRLTGAPLAPVTISLPSGVLLNAPDGSTALIVDLKTDAVANPSLDIAGRLTVNFGGRLVVTAGQAGDFRGRVAITADYR